MVINPHTPIGNCTTSDLFNELHRRLIAEAEREQAHSKHVRFVRLTIYASKVDAMHHDYAELRLT